MLRRPWNVLVRAALAVAALVARWRGGRQRLLRLHLSGALDEDAAPPRWRSLLGAPPGEDYFALLALLRAARQDPELEGVLITIDRLSAGWARLQGLRRAIAAVRDSGKDVWIHLTQVGMPEYYLASAAHRVILTPAGVLDVAGLAAEATFFLGALEKLGVRAEVVQMGRYKSAGEPFTRRGMSAEHREMIESLVDDLYGQIAAAVAVSRRLEAPAVRELLGRGPYVAREAQQAGLVDEIAYLDEVEEQMQAAHDHAPLVEGPAYWTRRNREIRRRALRTPQLPIAVLHVSGPIKMGESPPGARAAAGSTTLCKELERLAKDPKVAAVVLRIDSPGGSGLASDLIWRATKQLRRSKPVVVSLGDVAASGGYYIAAAGSPVVAEAGTITGSIGVLAGKATLQGLYGHLGITKDVVHRGDHAAIHSDYLPLSESERGRIQVEARTFYDDFLGKVAAGRGLSVDSVAAVAEGRVWTGQQALERGLVDQLGGLDDAIDEAKVLAGIARDALVPIVRLPRPRHGGVLSLLRWLPVGAAVQSLSPWLGVSLRERVWAVMPFQVRFF